MTRLGVTNALALLASRVALADVPTNCPYSASVGKWKFDVGSRGDGELTMQCGYDKLGAVTATHEFELAEENLVTNLKTGSTGTYTTIYNQGFQFEIDGNQWFVYYYFDNNGYECDKTSVGYVHDAKGATWGCTQGTKFQTNTIGKLNRDVESWQLDNVAVEYTIAGLPDTLFEHEPEFIQKLNDMNLPWTAARNLDNEKYTIKEHFYRAGGVIRRNVDADQMTVQEKIEKSKNLPRMAGVPENLDWRNIDGESFVSVVDDQGACGSCYSFAACGLMEARVRIDSGNTKRPNFSEQDVITCGKDRTYNQGCSGGWAFLTAGKYMNEFGLVEEYCAPYSPVSRSCEDVSSCKRWYSSEYEYLGGYYGATMGDDGAAMVEELQNGPVAVGFLVNDAFRTYSSGVFVDPGQSVTSEFNPIVSVNHAVLCVGYGVCGKNDPACDGKDEGMRYWIVKNSWGKSFGEQGYFKIIRGVNELGIESMPFRAVPIINM